MKKIVLFCFLTLQLWAENELVILSIQDTTESVTINWATKIPVSIESQSFTLDSVELNSTNNIIAPDDELKTSIYYLIDSSSPMRKSFKKEIKPFINQMIDKLDENRHIYQIATFDSEIEVLKTFDNEEVNSEEILNGIKIDGTKTELYRLTKEALMTLSAKETHQKYLLIFSDGDYEDVAWSHEEVIKFAKEQKITILSFGYRDSIKLQSLRKLAEESGGKIWIDNKLDSLDEIVKYFDNGGQIEISKDNLESLTGKLNLKLNVETSDYSFTEGIMIKVKKKVIEKNSSWYWYLLLLLPLYLGWYFYNKNRNNEILEELIEEVEVKKVLASIETQSGSLFDITKKSTSLGRDSDNDILIDGIYISKFHAEIMHKNGNFYIIDKNSENGVSVNSNQNVTQFELHDGDTIYLGPLELYFRVNEVI